MDMQYLIWLQEMRVNCGDGVENFFTIFTDASLGVAMVLGSIIFWVIDKRAGKFLLLVSAFGRLVNQLLKSTFCVYRPWILDPNVHPTAAAQSSASSYSFPSGHTNAATALYGGIAYYWRKKLPLLMIPCVLTVFLVAFSRNFLGVHTPQDVLVAILETVIVMIIVDKMMTFIDNENILTIGSIILGVIAAAYLLLKSYPVDYYNGKVIVEPIRALRDAAGNLGSFFGIIIGLALERRFVNFKADVNLSKKIFRVIAGLVVIAAINYLLPPILKLVDLGLCSPFLRWFVTNLAPTFFIPLLFVKLEKKLFI